MRPHACGVLLKTRVRLEKQCGVDAPVQGARGREGGGGQAGPGNSGGAKEDQFACMGGQKELGRGGTGGARGGSCSRGPQPGGGGYGTAGAWAGWVAAGGHACEACCAARSACCVPARGGVWAQAA